MIAGSESVSAARMYTVASETLCSFVWERMNCWMPVMVVCWAVRSATSAISSLVRRSFSSGDIRLFQSMTSSVSSCVMGGSFSLSIALYTSQMAGRVARKVPQTKR